MPPDAVIVETKHSLAEIKPTDSKYFVPAEDFLTPPPDILPYSEGDRVTRANFVPFIIRSFSVSLGEAAVQQEYFRWKSMHENFDWRTSVDNFFSAGGVSSMSDGEKDMLIKRYRDVNQHRNRGSEYPDSAILKKFTMELGAQLRPLNQRALSDYDLRRMTVEDLTKRAKELKAQRAED